MPTQIRYLGVAAFEVITPAGLRILIDPFLEENPVSPVKLHDLEHVDLVMVTHGAFDHLGDTLAILRRFPKAPLICSNDVMVRFLEEGIERERMMAMCWGLLIEVLGIRIRSVAAHHWSWQVLPDGRMLTGLPQGFMIDVAPHTRLYAMGDTAIFGDLKLLGELYRPHVGLVPVSIPRIKGGLTYGPFKGLAGELTAYEAFLASQWLQLEYAIPFHFVEEDNEDVRQWVTLLENAHNLTGPMVRPMPLKPGEIFTYHGKGEA